MPRDTLRHGALAIVLAATAALTTACSGEPDAYQEDYGKYEPLKVTGYPTKDTLVLTQRFVWKLADRDADGLEALAAPDEDVVQSDKAKTAKAWLRAYGTAAKGEVTADFARSPAKNQDVTLTFKGKNEQLDLSLYQGPDKWSVIFHDSDN
ncbi:hypothetical protein [Streptomyces sp. NPDC093707]|uniref:hypothetical protein n=1 Tax=Streptomyces sp. NPDC093707 TaxID=3154984 RepID=UPI00344C58F0